MSAGKFERFPMVMRHPQETPAIVSQWVPELGKHVPEHGQAAKWQPVTVHTEEQVEEYVAKGYVAAGDPQAYEAAANPTPPGYRFNEYPKWVGEVLVQNAEQEAALQPAATSTAEAPAPKAPKAPRAPKAPKARVSYKERTQGAADASTAAAGV